MTGQDPVAAFRLEAADLLEQIEHALLDLGGRLDDRNLIDEVFRGLHTLKGSGAMFGFDALAGFTHHCETAFDAVRKGVVAATSELVAVILSAKDHMRYLIDLNGDSDAVQADGDAILQQLQRAVEAAGGSTPASNGPAPSAADGENANTAAELSPAGWHLRFFLPAGSMANGTNPLILLDELRDLGDCKIRAITDPIPALADLDPMQIHMGWDVELRGDIAMSDIEDVFIFVMDDMTLEVQPLAPEPSEPTAPASASETAASPTSNPTPTIANTAAPAIKAPLAPAAQSAPNRDTAPVKAEETVRVPAERLDELMDRVGELVIAQSRLSQLAQGSGHDMVLRSVSEEIERLAGELRDTMMVLRLVPVSSLFNRFRRLVHDLARETGKRIDLVTEGEGTEVDKTVVERLADPLVHLIRNSCDHGLETPDQRLAAGKSETGTVRLSADQSGDEIIITIRDDGRGINKDAVRAKAEAQGLISAGQIMSDQDLFQLIFHPGFSTAAQVTNLSGRGVGMDVVKRTIESLRGTIHIASTAGEGSVITLRIPLTLAIIDGLLVRVGAERYVIPLAAVEECLEISQEEEAKTRGRSFITLRDSLVPFLRLRDMFACTDEPDIYQKIVVIATGSERVGLVVDQIIGSHQTVIKSMSLLHQNITNFAGATILGDGGIALILDVAQLIDIGRHQEERQSAAG
jgi:two-component system chemotaxis sensor kinase CheA